VTGYLLDTNALLLMALQSDAVPTAVTIDYAEGDRFVSHVSAIEIAIKWSIGKLPLPPPFQTDFQHAFAELAQFLSADILPIDLSQIALLGRLPLHHRDPFDRLIIAQALAENLTVVTRDRVFALYPGLDVLEI
jgi:PIN domain nuclease of toxin-antitoxin system